MSKQIRGQPRKVAFPLSSRRLKLYQLQQLAQALELPTSDSSDDLRVMVEEKLRAMDRNPLNTQVLMDLQEEGTENLSLQDEEGQFLHVTSPVLSPDSGSQSTPWASPTHVPECPEVSQGEKIEKEVQEALIADSAQAQGELTAPTIQNEEFTELKADHVKLQEQLQCVIDETNLLRQGLEEREKELGVLKHIMAQDKVLIDELGHRNEILQQQQQHSNEEIERLNKAAQAGKVRIKELWRINCEQLTEFDQILSTKEEELQSLTNLLQSRPVSEFSSPGPPRTELLSTCVTWPTSRSSVTQPLCSASSVSGMLTSVNEALPRVSECLIM